MKLDYTTVNRYRRELGLPAPTTAAQRQRRTLNRRIVVHRARLRAYQRLRATGLGNAQASAHLGVTPGRGYRYAQALASGPQ